jgi:hypothetical protein
MGKQWASALLSITVSMLMADLFMEPPVTTATEACLMDNDNPDGGTDDQNQEVDRLDDREAPAEPSQQMDADPGVS